MRYFLILLTAMAAFSQPRPQTNPLLNGNPYISPPEVKGGPVLRLPDGKPDLQGVWLVRSGNNSMSMISVEAIAGREGLRAEMIAREHARVARRNLEDALKKRDMPEDIVGAKLMAV